VADKPSEQAVNPGLTDIPKHKHKTMRQLIASQLVQASVYNG
jgi:hypothetical protein